MYRSRAIGELSTTADHLPDLRERLQPERVFPQEGLRHPLAQLHQRQVRKKCQTDIFARSVAFCICCESGQFMMPIYIFCSGGAAQL